MDQRTAAVESPALIPVKVCVLIQVHHSVAPVAHGHGTQIPQHPPGRLPGFILSLTFNLHFKAD